MAHLAAVQTRTDRLQRKQQKLSLVRKLYQQGFEREDVLNLLAFVDWVLTLPQDLEREFLFEVEQLEAEQRMQYVTSFERSGIRLGLLEGIELGLELKFGAESLSLMSEISLLSDIEQLRAIKEGIKTAATIAELRQIYQSPANET
ncbi:hypothetical protein GS682_32220 [Nostoc sp. B(2019)]|nr:hypothetical protein [Nostoc sp. B(2019)]